jgi:hypothetical protein
MWQRTVTPLWGWRRAAAGTESLLYISCMSSVCSFTLIICCNCKSLPRTQRGTGSTFAEAMHVRLGSGAWGSWAASGQLCHRSVVRLLMTPLAASIPRYHYCASFFQSSRLIAKAKQVRESSPQGSVQTM